MPTISLHLYRHSKVDSHRGDVSLSDDAATFIDQAAEALIPQIQPDERLLFLSTETRRTRDTAIGLRDRLAASCGDVNLRTVTSEHALRNPDLYLAGHRVEMVSSSAAFVAQVPPGLISEEGVENSPFFGSFLKAADRIGYWLSHPDPAGEDARSVARRVLTYCKSLGDAEEGKDTRIIAVSHSPVIRAVLVHFMGLGDPGEPDWVEPIDIQIEKGSGLISFRDQTRTFS